ncbi:MAG: EAL domain-containing protein [Pseudoxanthomonas sp.]
MEPAERIPGFRSSRAVRLVGVVLGVVITAVVALFIWVDRETRIEAARRQSSALARGADRLLHAELANLERVALGLLSDARSLAEIAPEPSQRLLSRAALETESRHPELAPISLFDSDGALLVGDPNQAPLSAWKPDPLDDADRLLFGPVSTSQGSNPVVPFALRTRQNQRLVSGLHLSRFQWMIERLDVGREGSIAVLDLSGRVLARYGGRGSYAGRTVALPASLATDKAVNVDLVSQLDGVKRFATFSSQSGYPFVVVTGISSSEALGPWWTEVVLASLLALLYWLGLTYLVKRLTHAERIRAAILEEFEAQADWLRQAQIAADSGVWRIESDPGLVRASAQTAALFGFARQAGTIPVKDFFDRMHPEDRERVADEFARAREQEAAFHSEYRILVEDGAERWISTRGAMVRDVRGLSYMAGTIADITDRRRQEARLQQARLQAQELFERNPLPFWVFDLETLRFLAVNEAAVKSYGYSRQEFLQMTILDIRPPSDARDVRASLDQKLEADESKRTWVHLTRDSRIISVTIHSSASVFNGRPARLVLAEDVSERVAFQKELSWRATHDVTTDLLNLPALIDFLDDTQRVGPGSDYAICYVQLRDFDLVAPTLGRSASTRILLEAARRFGAVAASYGVVAYRPADAFVIAALDTGRIGKLVEALKEAIAQPLRNEDGGIYPLEAWIGVAQGPLSGETAENVIGHAALAALRARREHLPALEYDDHMGEEASQRIDLVSTLRLAFERREFELFFQPVHQISDGRIVGLEALLRWPQSDGSFIPPAQFIPLCEESGLIVPIGAWVMEQAARAHGVLAAHCVGEVAIAVNVSAVQFMTDSLPDLMRDLRSRFDLPRGALHIELTESALLHRPEAVRAVMDELRTEGVCISIDDFGTGFSSMAYLRDLPLDYLKLDRSFVRDVDCDVRNASICQALIALAHGLGLQVIAEGVETAGQLEWMRANHCDHAQGYLLGRPGRLPDLIASWPGIGDQQGSADHGTQPIVARRVE